MTLTQSRLVHIKYIDLRVYTHHSSCKIDLVSITGKVRLYLRALTNRCRGWDINMTLFGVTQVWAGQGRAVGVKGLMCEPYE